MTKVFFFSVSLYLYATHPSSELSLAYENGFIRKPSNITLKMSIIMRISTRPTRDPPLCPVEKPHFTLFIFRNASPVSFQYDTIIYISVENKQES